MAKRHLALLGFLFVALMCSTGEAKEKYVTRDGSVYYTYWTFSFGQQSHELPQVDAASFKQVKGWLGRDNRHVYFKERLVEGADPVTLKADKYPLCHDANDYYHKGEPLHVASVKDFVVLKWSDDNFWARDGRYAYYNTRRIEGVDLKSFKVTSHCSAVDGEHVYRYGKLLPLADPKTYVEDWKGFYSRDKAHIWYMGELLKDADYDSFVVDGDSDAHDKFGSFKRGERVK